MKGSIGFLLFRGERIVIRYQMQVVMSLLYMWLLSIQEEGYDMAQSLFINGHCGDFEADLLDLIQLAFEKDDTVYLSIGLGGMEQAYDNGVPVSVLKLILANR